MRARDDPVVETPDFLLAALERANEAVVIVDRDLRVTHFNAAAELIWQLDRAEAIGCHVSHLGLKDLAVARSASDQRRGSEIAIQRKDGSRILAALSLSPVEIDGQSRTIAFVRDMPRRPTDNEVCWRNWDATSFRDFSMPRALSSHAFGRWLLDHSAERASLMLARIGRSLAEPTAGPSPRAAAVQRSASSSMVD
jgi:PAS domain S-box-containing protein